MSKLLFKNNYIKSEIQIRKLCIKVAVYFNIRKPINTHFTMTTTTTKKHKICMLGSFAVGKTSLVRRYVDSVFSETYITTIGVRVDKKAVSLPDADIFMILWDVYGQDTLQGVLPAYLRGLAGYILVVDPTRPSTYIEATSLQKLVQKTLGDKPFVLVKNKSDLHDQWHADVGELEQLEENSFAVLETSAKNDTGVTEVFETMARALLNKNRTVVTNG